jgi:hypothetical protein
VNEAIKPSTSTLVVIVKGRKCRAGQLLVNTAVGGKSKRSVAIMIVHHRSVVATEPELGMAIDGPVREREIDTAQAVEVRQWRTTLVWLTARSGGNLVRRRTDACRVLEMEDCWMQMIAHCFEHSVQSQNRLQSSVHRRVVQSFLGVSISAER